MSSFRPSPRVVSNAIDAAVFFAVAIISLLSFSCDGGPISRNEIDSLNLDDVRGIVSELSNPNRIQPRDRVLMIEQIVQKYYKDGKLSSIPAFLGLCVQLFHDDPYKA